MPWIDQDHPLHRCELPQWKEGDELLPNYSLWGCPECGKVYSLLKGRFAGTDGVWKPSYSFMPIDKDSKFYIPKEKTMKTQFEYDIINLYPAVRGNVADREALDAAGKEGWELVSIQNVDGQLQAYLKRKIK